MGHDITAIRKSSIEKNSNDELSYIRIGAWNNYKAYMLYEALNAQDCNAGVSGNGVEREFSPDELKIAISKFKYMTGESKEDIIAEVIGDEDMEYNNEDIMRFLTDIQVDEPVIIEFY